MGSGFAGGVFRPSLFLGTMLGAPILTVLITFEISGSYNVTLVVVIAAAFASTVMQLGSYSSFFRWRLTRRGVNISSGRDVSLLMTHIPEAAHATLQCHCGVNANWRNGIAAGRERQRVVIVVDEEEQFIGSLDLRGVVVQFIEKGRESPIAACLAEELLAVDPDCNVVAALQKMVEAEIDCLPIIGPQEATDSNVHGVIFRNDQLVEHYEVLRKAREDEFGVA